MIEIEESLSSFRRTANEFLTSSNAVIQMSTTFSYLSRSVIKPRLNCLLTLSTSACALATISGFFSASLTSAIEIEIPDNVEYLKPKSLSLSSIIDVSVVWYLL